jgi:hypothetical protein
LTQQAIEISAIEEVTAWCRFRAATPALDYNPVPSVSATCLGRIEYGTYTTVVINTEVSMKETWFVTGSSVGLGRSIAEAALAEGHDVVASARCAGGTDCKERCHEIDPCRTSCSGHGIDRGAAHQPRRRVLATRWPAKETVADQSQGVQLAKLQRLVRYWGTDYDWRKGEAKLNALPMFVTEIDGLDIQFIHVRSRHENAMPLIMSHGWPGPRSWVERSYHKLIYFNEVDKGGHFAAWEEPELFSTEVRAAFTSDLCAEGSSL